MNRSFAFGGQKYKYFDHPANSTRINERRVELPIIMAVMRRREGRVLEVGNVLSQYMGRKGWTTVDLREKEDGVVNADIVEWSGGPFDLVVSISTFEHIGIDSGRDPFRAIDAVLRCASHLLAPGGRFVFTVPVGYNPVLDAWLFNRWAGKTGYLMRVSEDNRWKEADEDPVRSAKYGSPYPYANAVIVGDFVRAPGAKPY